MDMKMSSKSGGPSCINHGIIDGLLSELDFHLDMDNEGKPSQIMSEPLPWISQ